MINPVDLFTKQIASSAYASSGINKKEQGIQPVISRPEGSRQAAGLKEAFAPTSFMRASELDFQPKPAGYGTSFLPEGNDMFFKGKRIGKNISLIG